MWKETGKGIYSLFLEERTGQSRRASALIFDDREKCGCYTYSGNFNRTVTHGKLISKDLESAKREVEALIQDKEDNRGNYITLYYTLEYYVMVPPDRFVIVDKDHIKACPPEKFRTRRLEELQKAKDVTEIWQCSGAILAEMIKTAVYREYSGIETIYDAVTYSGKLLWTRKEERKEKDKNE